MPHFFVPPSSIRGDVFVLNAEEARHLFTVLRKKPGDDLRFFDGQGRNFTGRLVKISMESAEGKIIAEEKAESFPWRLRLFQGLPKGDKFDWILEKMTELGAAEIVPIHTERSVAKIPADRLPSRIKRWEKIVLAAAKQSGRASVPGVSPPVNFSQALDMREKNALALFPWEGEENKSLKDVLRSRSFDGNFDVDIFVGPEGGFSPKEAEAAQQRGAVLVTLGPLILRTETAGLVVASTFLYEFGTVKK